MKTAGFHFTTWPNWNIREISSALIKIFIPFFGSGLARLGMKDIYILMLTAKGQERDRQIGRDAGVDSYITKPVDSDAILAKAADVLGIEI